MANCTRCEAKIWSIGLCHTHYNQQYAAIARIRRLEKEDHLMKLSLQEMITHLKIQGSWV